MKQLIAVCGLIILPFAMFAQKNPFNLPFRHHSSDKLRLDGAYLFCEEIKWSRSQIVAFYSNGIVFIGPFAHNANLGFDSVVCSKVALLMSNNSWADKFRFGVYTVLNDTLTIQITKPSEVFGNRYVEMTKWVVEAGAIRKIERVVEQNWAWAKKLKFSKNQMTLNEEKDYNFFPVMTKPDSNMAFFYHCPWFPNK